jgi:CheY-like chemotaxis protein
MNILIVEDNPTDLKLLSAVLESSGHRVLGTGSDYQLVETIKAHQPEIILLDLLLPIMDGLQLARVLKADASTSHIPIVAMTAAPEKFSKVDALAAGCTAYIAKPLDAHELANLLVKVVLHSEMPMTKGA